MPERENLTILSLGDRGSRCQEKAQFEAVWSGGKKGGSQVEITSLNSHSSGFYSGTRCGVFYLSEDSEGLLFQ